MSLSRTSLRTQKHRDHRAILVLLCQQFSQTVESFLPERASIGDPAFGHGEPLRFNAAGANSAGLFSAHQAAFFEDLQVLHDSRQSDGQRFGQSGNRNRALAQTLDDRTTSRIAERMEDTVDLYSLPRVDPSLTKHGGAFPVQRESTCHFSRETLKQFGPAFLPHLRAIGAFEERCLLGEDQVGSLLRRQQFERRLR
jgi:hypothetical protein